MKTQKQNFNRFLTEDEVTMYIKEENLAEKFENLYNSFVESDINSVKNQINKLNNNDYTKFVIHVLDEMRVDPREFTRVLRSIVD